MKINIPLLSAIAGLCAASAGHATTITLTNGDFEATTANAFPQGFDIPGNDVPGWENHGTITDSGVENAAAWWGTYSGYSAFAQRGEGAKNLSSYTITTGDEFTISLFAKTWDTVSEVTLTLYYNDVSNVIGTYSSNVNSSWISYSNPTPIAATPGSVGGTLGIIVQNSSTTGFLNFDEVSIEVIPEPSTTGLLGAAMGALLLRRRGRN